MAILSRARAWAGAPPLRHFAAEILIVVIGVLIALAVNEWADRRRWDREVKEFRAAADIELGNDLWNIRFRAEQGPCTEARLVELDRLAAAWQRGERLRLDHPIPGMDLRNVRVTLWESRTPEVTSHLPLKVRVDYARAYHLVEVFQRQMLEDRSLWRPIRQANFATRMSEADAVATRTSIAAARAQNGILVSNYRLLVTNAARLGVTPLTPEFDKPWSRAICKPLHWSPA